MISKLYTNFKYQSGHVWSCAFGITEVENILLRSDPNAVRDRLVNARLIEVCTPLEEGIVKVKAIDLDHGAGLETKTRVAAVVIANGDRNHSTAGVSALGSDDDQVD